MTDDGRGNRNNVSSSQFLFNIENAIEALEVLQVHPLHTDWVTRSDYYHEIKIPLGTSVDALLDDLRKKRDQVRKAVYDEEMESLEEWERISAQGQASHQPAEQDA